MAREVYNPLYLSPHNFGKREGNSNNAIEVHLVPPATRAIVFSANASLPVVGRSISMYFRMYLRNVKRGEQRARFLCSGAREGERVGAGRRRGGWELALGEESTIFTVYRGIKVEICRGFHAFAGAAAFARLDRGEYRSALRGRCTASRFATWNSFSASPRGRHSENSRPLNAAKQKYIWTNEKKEKGERSGWERERERERKREWLLGEISGTRRFVFPCSPLRFVVLLREERWENWEESIFGESESITGL